VGGIRTGTWEGALVVGPWGDWRRGAFRMPCAPHTTAAPRTAGAAHTTARDIGPGQSGNSPVTGHPIKRRRPHRQVSALLDRNEVALDDTRGRATRGQPPDPRPQLRGHPRSPAQRTRTTRPASREDTTQ